MRHAIATGHQWVEYAGAGWQFGETGMLAALARLLPPGVPRWCFECGCGNSTTYPITCAALINAGWNSVLADADEQAVACVRARNVPGATVLHATLAPEDGRDIDALLAGTDIPHDFGVMVLDVDSCDLELWERMVSYRPALACVEHLHIADRRDACLMLARWKGYVPLATTFCNTIMARADIAPCLVKPEPMRLRVASDGSSAEGYEPVPPAAVGGCTPGLADEVCVVGALSGMDQAEAGDLLKRCAALLRPSGVLRVAAADFPALAAMRGPDNMGVIDRAIAQSRSVWCPLTLRRAMYAAGIGHVAPYNHEDAPDGGPAALMRLAGRRRWWPRVDRPRVGLTISEPRLTFAAMHRCMIATVAEMSRRYEFVNCAINGPFWDKALEHAIGLALSHECHYVLVADYDSVFTPEDAAALIEALQEDPTLAAATALQISRSTGKPLLYGNAGDYTGPRTETAFHHFGLAALRADVFRELPHPWLWSVPGPDGRWSHPLTSDADITFWRNLAEHGFRAVRLNNVTIGHVQECVMWPHPDGIMYQPVTHYVGHGRPPESRFDAAAYESRMKTCPSPPQTPAIPSPTNCSRRPTPA